jgi:hypothetical protein
MRASWIVAAAAASLVFAAGAVAGSPKPATTAFSNTPLIATWNGGIPTSPNANSTGDSEPAIAFGQDGRMAVDGLAWLPFQVNLWTGRFGSTPSYFGGMDQSIPTSGNGRIALGDGDADLDIASTGTLHLADLDFLFNNNGGFQLGVSVTNCPASATGPAGCKTVVLDKTQADRQWITSLGKTVWVSYHDSASSTLIHVQKSTDDGATWQQSGDPVVGQGSTTGSSTFNNIQGPIVADPTTGNVYDIYASGTPQSKCCSADFDHVYVSRSTDGGAHYTAQLVFTAPVAGTALDNIFPSLAVDPSNGNLYATWSDGHGVWESTSTDHGVSWSMALKVSSTATSIMPWVAARNGKADVVYYGSNQAQDDTSAVWNVYDAQTTGAGWTTKQVSNTPNRIGAVCTNGDGCSGNRELLDLFEVAEDPATNKAAIIYTDTTIDTWTSSTSGTHQLPEVVLAFEK